MHLKVAFIFDMDGVIVDSNPFHKIALKQFCSKYGHQLTEEQLAEKIYGRRNQDWLAYIFGPLEENQMNQYADEKEALFRELYEKDAKPLEGLISFLQKLEEKGIPCAIATSAPRDNVDFTLAKTGAARYFNTILDSSFVTQGKPHPEIYLKTAKALGFQPQNCVVFEDSLSGVDSAKTAGCKVVGITTTHSGGELNRTDYNVDNFFGLDPQKMISRLFGT